MYLPHIAFGVNPQGRPKEKDGPKCVGSLTGHPLPSAPNFRERRLGEVRRNSLSSTREAKERERLRRISLDDQGEAEAEAEGVPVAVVSRAVFSGAATVFWTVFSTVTVRAGGAGGAAPSRLPPPMRPRKNPK